MREIKFRQWIARHKTMHYRIGIITEGHWNGPPSVVFQENPLMQFTGLRDKNEKEIYEGDVVKKHYGYEKDKTEIIFEVIFESGCFTGKEISSTGFYYMEWPSDYFINCEVVGNIYENSQSTPSIDERGPIIDGQGAGEEVK